MIDKVHNSASSLANGRKACGGERRVLSMSGDGAEGQTRLMHGCRQAVAGNATADLGGMPAGVSIDGPQLSATISTEVLSTVMRRARQERAIRSGAHPRWMHATPSAHGDSMDAEERGTQKCQMERIGNTEHRLLPIRQSLPIERVHRSGRPEDPRRTGQHTAAKDMTSTLANCDSRQYEGAYDSRKERGLLQTTVSGIHRSAATDKGSKTAHTHRLPEVKDIDVPTRGSLPESITVTGSVHQYGIMYTEALVSPPPSYGADAGGGAPAQNR